jgi:hypothetical protein
MINSKYFRVPKKKEPLQENEVHVTTRQEPINFIRYAIFLFERRNLPYIKFKASGSAIASLVNIAEILKKTIPGIHQVNKIYTLKYEQDYEPKEKGLDHVTIVRNVPILEISFYKILLTNEVVNEYGYQPALSQEVFERVQINISKLFYLFTANLIRKRTTDMHQRTGGFRDNRSNYTGSHFSNNQRPTRGYSYGFRGRRGGRGGQVGRFTPGFRGRARLRGHMGNHQNQMIQNDSYPTRGTRVRGFGVYRSKFDNVEPRNPGNYQI